MAKTPRASEDPVNDLVLTIFWLNGFFLDAADRLTAGSGLTTARWQVLGRCFTSRSRWQLSPETWDSLARASRGLRICS